VRLAVAVLVLLVAGAAPASAGPAVIAGADPETYVLDLSYDASRVGTLTGTERIDFVNRGPAALDRVWLRLWANGPDRCRPRHIEVRVEAPAQAGRARCSALEVRLAAPVAPGATGTLALSFTVKGRAKDDRFGHAGEIALLGNVIPVLAVEDERGLHLDPYSRQGDAFYSLGARWDATLSLPARLRAATTGVVVSDTVAGDRRTLRLATAQARDFALAIGPMKVRTTRSRGVLIRAFVGPRTRGVGASLRAARRTVSALERRLSPYGSTELDVLLLGNGVGGFGGMEYPELVFTQPEPVVVAHEVAHQWWYGIVGDDQYLEPWLDESFASYFDHRLQPSWDFCLPRRPWYSVSDGWHHIPLNSSMALFDRADELVFPEVVYDAGACVLERLERDIGRTRMTAFLRLLQSRFRFGVMRTTDVLDAIHHVAPRYSVRRWVRLAHLSVR
jgi:Peptidase family M1 domain